MLRNILLPIVLIGSLTIPCVGEDDDDKSPGLKVGSKALNFTLTDQAGKKQELFELLKKGPVAVVFHRSAEW